MYDYQSAWIDSGIAEFLWPHFGNIRIFVPFTWTEFRTECGEWIFFGQGAPRTNDNVADWPIAAIRRYTELLPNSMHIGFVGNYNVVCTLYNVVMSTNASSTNKDSGALDSKVPVSWVVATGRSFEHIVNPFWSVQFFGWTGRKREREL